MITTAGKRKDYHDIFMKQQPLDLMALRDWKGLENLELIFKMCRQKQTFGRRWQTRQDKRIV